MYKIKKIFFGKLIKPTSTKKSTKKCEIIYNDLVEVGAGFHIDA